MSLYTQQAKNEYERSERKRAKARDAGEGTWMLASVTDRIEREQKVKAFPFSVLVIVFIFVLSL